jgi:hypothetical protein
VPYSTLLIQNLRDTFGLTLNQTADLFSALPAAPISDLLRSILDEYIPLASAIGTDEDRSEGYHGDTEARRRHGVFESRR